ncbi:hypothetical protein DPM19_31045 [Actinomadura craniellae]|uniref:Uncharacterized protein n=1 Tax=Actinomadura craniellae TaxID=2231787 RepID=A0A365GWQ6_9ACTN|nr:hypothetical protein [Actinomadura craniellae]RAY11198.1 hypothetical protein DPM19_31045 [Actinomadura craniellae]
MHALTRLGVSALTVCAAVTLLPSGAQAATTTVRRDGPKGDPYSGEWRLSTLNGFAFVSPGFTTSGFISPGLTVKCAGATLGGKVDSGGEAALDTGVVDKCEDRAGGVQVTVRGLPYKARVTYAPFSPGPIPGSPDGELMISHFQISIAMGTIAPRFCNYGTPVTVRPHSLPLYNRDNPGRPDPADETQVSTRGLALTLLPGSGTFCPPSGQLQAVFQVRGRPEIGIPGSFGQKLYVTS